MKLLSSLLHLIYPQLCLACGDDSVDEELVCFNCISQLPYTQFHLHRDNKTERVFHGRVKIEYGMSLLYFSKSMLVQNLLHELKYRNQKELGHYLGQLIGRSLRQNSCFADLDVIIPLPLSDRKNKLRGYNQSELLCNGIGEVLSKPVSVGNVIRPVHTSTQTLKHRRERWLNVEGIFEVSDATVFEGRHVLLVDDVLTTGATLEACAAVMSEIPGIRISIATLAIVIK